MSSIFPDAIDGFEQLPLVVDGITPVNAFSVNTIRSAILNVETELGINPSGSSDTVSGRIQLAETDLLALETEVSVLEAQVDH
jgi:hypothetical protein